MKYILKNIPSIVLFIMLVILSILVTNLNILPTKYYYIFLISEFFLLGFILFLYNMKNKLSVIIAIVLMVMSFIGNCFLYYYLNTANKYLDNNFSVSSYKEKIDYIVVAGINNNVKGIEEVDKTNTIYYYKYSREVDKALKKLGDYNYQSIDDGYTILWQIKDNNNIFIISKLDFEFIVNANDSLNFDQFNIINEFDVVDEVKVNNATPTSYNIFVSGMDYARYRRDFNAIITVNTKTHKIVITTLSRDLYLYVPAYGVNDTLSNLGRADPNNTKEALENLFNIKIDYTVNLYTENLVQIVDTIGGVEFCSNNSFYTSHDTTLGSYSDNGRKVYVSEGCNNYNGLEILAISRERLHIGGYREDNCRQIIINIGRKIASQINLSNYQEIINSFDGSYSSNINKKTITNLVKEGLDNPNFEIIEKSVQGTAGTVMGRLGGELYTITPSEEVIQDVSGTIKDVINEK